MIRLSPVLLPMPERARDLVPRERVALQSAVARDAVKESARLAQVATPEFRKDDRDVPQPDGDVFWSLTHTTRWVGGVVAPRRVGIDVEGPRPVREEIARKILDDDEASVLGGREGEAFLRAWTSKEAVLKCEGVGIAGLSRCRIRAMRDEDCLELSFDGHQYAVHNHVFDEHVAALCVTPQDAPREAVQVDWTELSEARG